MNKIDITDKPFVSDEEIKTFVGDNQIELFKVSAKTGEGINDAMRRMAELLMQTTKPKK